MRQAEMTVGLGRKNTVSQDRSLLIVMDAEPVCRTVLGYQGEQGGGLFL